MQNLKKTISMLLIFVMMMSVCAFTEEAGNDPVLAADDQSIVVNGTIITGAKINECYDYYISYYSQSYDVTDATIKAQIRNIAVQNCIQEILMAQKADEMNIFLTEEEEAEVTASAGETWDSALINCATTLYGYTESLSDEEKTNLLSQAAEYLSARSGYDRQSYVDSMLQAERLNKLYNMLTADAVVDASEVEARYQELAASDEELFAGNVYYYESYQYYGYSSYYVPEGYRGIKQILVSVDDTLLQDYLTKSSALASGTEGVTENDVNAAKDAVFESVKDTLDDISTSFANGTATFDELIAKYNIDPGMTSEPYMLEGYSVHADSIMWDPAFISAAMSIDSIGGISEPAIGSYGIYICYYLRDVPAGIQPMTEEVSAEIESSLLSNRKSEAFGTNVEQWIAESTITYSDAFAAYMTTTAQ